VRTHSKVRTLSTFRKILGIVAIIQVVGIALIVIPPAIFVDPQFAGTTAGLQRGGVFLLSLIGAWLIAQVVVRGRRVLSRLWWRAPTEPGRLAKLRRSRTRRTYSALGVARDGPAPGRAMPRDLR
jgi:hypothetical protein